MEQQKLESAQTVVGSKSADRRKRKVTVGSIWESKTCGSFKVIEYNGCEDVLIKFLTTGTKVRVQASTVRGGYIKDKNFPSVLGVGFIGYGEFETSHKGKNNKAYLTWSRMLQRCYSEQYHKKQPTYIGCEVCDEWKNFQNFAKWYYENYPSNGGSYDLDKDLKTPGNKIYSPNTCTFLSKNINAFIVNSGPRRGGLLIGVSKTFSGLRFVAQCRNPFTMSGEYIGTFGSEIEAHLAWRKRKSELTYKLAQEQECEEIKLMLINWKKALDNFEIHKI